MSLPIEGLASGRAPPDANAPWPKVTSYPHPTELSAMLRRPIESRILLLDAREPNGYVREWQPPGLTADRHWAYGVQWYAFAVLAIVLWLILGLRREIMTTGRRRISSHAQAQPAHRSGCSRRSSSCRSSCRSLCTTAVRGARPRAPRTASCITRRARCRKAELRDAKG